MSRFLGPIHHWLFNKIKLYEDLEKEVVDAFKEQYDGIEKIVENNINEYGERLPNKPLEEIIDTGNIHGWLQSKIVISETRHAGILRDLFNTYKDDGVLLANSVYKENGIKCGLNAKEQYAPSNAEELYKILNNYILDGMPCDNINNVTDSTADKVEYKHDTCLHINYWNKAGVEPNKMYDLRRIWTESFINSANPEFKYQVTIEEDNGNRKFHHTIFKK